MRELTSTLMAAQKKAAAMPFVKVEAVNKTTGVVKYTWSRLYDGSEDDYYHAVTVPGDGSLIRVRITPPSDSRKLYRQRVANPGVESDYSQWTYTNQYNAVVAAAISLENEVSIFWIKSNREIRRIKSTDYGASWGSPELIDYSPTTYIYGLAAAYKPCGDVAIFFADQSTLYAKKCVSGQWQAKAAWDKTTGDLSGIACVYGTDWNLVVTGKDSSANYKIWSLVYGDGGDVSIGTWSELKEFSSAPSGGNFEFGRPFLDKTDVYRCFFIEKFTGTEAYNRPLWSYSVIGTGFVDNLWREPVPFNLSSEYGLAMAHGSDYGWLSSPDGVWRAELDDQSLDLTADVISIRQEVGNTYGRLVVTLRNDDGRYASPGQDDLGVLNTGCQLDFGPGYITTGGNEYSSGQSYCLESLEHRSAGGSASLVIYARDGWEAMSEWKARHQYRWNKTSADMSVKDIINLILSKVGLKLEVISQSTVITDFCPDFTVNSGDNGKAVIQRLLSYVPDILFTEGNKAYIVNPLSSDSSEYSYGPEHQIWDGIYSRDAMGVNRIQVEGYDAGGFILADSFSWEEIDRSYDRLLQLEESNIASVTEAQQLGQTYLKQVEMGATGGNILIPVNCGQQLYDVIDISDIRVGFDSEKRRVLGMVLVFHPPRGEYNQRLWLGAV